MGRQKNMLQLHKQSLSRIVKSYFQSLVNHPGSDTDSDMIEISAFVKSMSTDVHLPADLNIKKDYSNYLSEKYN